VYKYLELSGIGPKICIDYKQKKTEECCRLQLDAHIQNNSMCALYTHRYKDIPGAQWDWRGEWRKLRYDDFRYDDLRKLRYDDFTINVCVHYTNICVNTYLELSATGAKNSGQSGMIYSE